MATDSDPPHDDLDARFGAWDGTAVLSDWWLRIAAIDSAGLSLPVVLPPRSMVRIGDDAERNELVLPQCGFRSLTVITGGTTLHVPSEARIRMARRTVGLAESAAGTACDVESGSETANTFTRETHGPFLEAAAELINFRIRDGLTLLIEYHQSREEAERLAALLRT